MAKIRTRVIKLESEKDGFLASNIASDIAREFGFDKLETSQIVLAVSEIAGNAIKFANKGVVKIKPTRNKKSLEITVKDKGPGIKNIKKVMEEGYTTQKGSLGLGLKGAQRAMDEFHIRSKVGQGTTVVMKKYLPILEEEIEYGIAAAAAAAGVVNGDVYVIKEFEGDKVLLAVIDGTGEGAKANKAANFVKDLIEKNYKSDPAVIISKCDKFLRKLTEKRGAVAGLCILKPQSLEYLGIGDTFIDVICPDQKISFLNQGGIVGTFKLPTLRTQRHRCRRKVIIIMCSDGIMHRFTENDLPLDQSAQKIADFIMGNYQREYGDATVLVAKRKK